MFVYQRVSLAIRIPNLGSTSPKPSPIKPSISFTSIHPQMSSASFCVSNMSVWGGWLKKNGHPNVRISIWLFNSSPWKIHPFLSSVNHLFYGPSIPWQTVSHNQRVDVSTTIHSPLAPPGRVQLLSRLIVFLRRPIQCEAPKISKLVNRTPITMVYGTQITIVTGANLNQQTSLGGLTL